MKKTWKKVLKWFKKGKWSLWTTTDSKGRKYFGFKFNKKF